MRRKYYDVHSQHSEIITGLEEAIIRFAKGIRSLKDEQVRESVALLLKTYQTEQSGLIYEHTGADPIVNSLGRELRSFLEQCRAPQPGQNLLRLGDVIGCLEVLLADIDYHASATGQDTYLDFITRTRPDLAQSSSSSLLI